MTTGAVVISDFLGAVPAWFLATSTEGTPHIRPFSFVASSGDDLWFCTSTEHDVYRELQGNPACEIAAYQPGLGCLIVTGFAVFSEEVSELIRRAGYNHLRTLGDNYISHNDPHLVFFKLDKAHAKLTHSDGTSQEIDLSPEADYEKILAANKIAKEKRDAEQAEKFAAWKQEQDNIREYTENYEVFSELVD